MFRNFAQRLTRDIEKRVKKRQDMNRVALQERGINPPESAPLDVNVISHKYQRFAVFCGGSMLADAVRVGSLIAKWRDWCCRRNSAHRLSQKHSTKNMGLVSRATTLFSCQGLNRPPDNTCMK